eukprot:scaffold98736_cov66-Phaeocystis_antarctica.AAC.1
MFITVRQLRLLQLVAVKYNAQQLGAEQMRTNEPSAHGDIARLRLACGRCARPGNAFTSGVPFSSLRLEVHPAVHRQADPGDDPARGRAEECARVAQLLRRHRPHWRDSARDARDHLVLEG